MIANVICLAVIFAVSGFSIFTIVRRHIAAKKNNASPGCMCCAARKNCCKASQPEK